MMNVPLVNLAERARSLSSMHDLNAQLRMMDRMEIELTGQINDMVTASSDYTPGGPEAKAFEEQLARLNQVQKNINMKKQVLQTQLQLNQTAYQNVQG